jgi:hypothetical protein
LMLNTFGNFSQPWPPEVDGGMPLILGVLVTWCFWLWLNLCQYLVVMNWCQYVMWWWIFVMNCVCDGGVVMNRCQYVFVMNKFM